MAAWTYSDWDTAYTDGSAEQLLRLKQYIKEISDWLNTGNTAVEGKSHEKGFWMDEVKRLGAIRDQLQVRVSTAAGTQSPFTRGRATF
jgi:hypothetical protein